ncbi:MAG: hypothetical protein K5880_14010 [Hydrogenophaga sp.]|nr:hypothetical protein [Hydrogenophaga sp.]
MFIRDLEEHKARAEGVPTEGEIMERARESGYWTEDDDDVEERAVDHIAYLEGEFKARAKFKSRQNIIRLQIDDAQAKLEHTQAKRNGLKQQTAEYLAHEVASFMLLRRVALRPDGTPLIPNDAVHLSLKENYLMFIFYLIYEMMSEGAFETAEIREIARSTEWRLTWGLARENLPSIFGCAVGDFSINHKMLIYWSRVYDSAFESTEPPEADIVDDDDRFDDWLATRDLERKDKVGRSTAADHHQERGHMLDGEYVEQCLCGMKAKNAGKGLGERLPHQQHCLYGTWHEFTQEEKEARARQVYGRNTANVRKLLDSEQEQVLKRGVVEEQDLRGKRTRSMLSMPTKVIPIRR